MSNYKCPHCGILFSTSGQESTVYACDRFFYEQTYKEVQESSKKSGTSIKITFYTCPECLNLSIHVDGIGEKVKDIGNLQIYPFEKTAYIDFPDYIPEAILIDYKEACLINDLSPKASATLARRCLQGIIHDFWDIQLKNLNQEITALKDKLDPHLWGSINALRQLGNIGAHMESNINTIVDIDCGESTKLIKLIERLIKEWYIQKHDREVLLSEIIDLNSNKQNLRES